MPFLTPKQLFDNLHQFKKFRPNPACYQYHADELFNSLNKDKFFPYEAEKNMCYRLEQYTVFDLQHHSDEQCELHLFTFDSQPAAIISKNGDKTDWIVQFLNKEVAEKVDLYLLSFIDEDKYEDIDLIDNEEGLNLKSHYITHCQADNNSYYFTFNEPRWVIDLQSVQNEFSAFFYNSKEKSKGKDVLIPCKVIGLTQQDVEKYSKEYFNNRLIDCEIEGKVISTSPKNIMYRYIRAQ